MELAKTCGVAQVTVSQWESEDPKKRSATSPKHMETLVNVLGILNSEVAASKLDTEMEAVDASLGEFTTATPPDVNHASEICLLEEAIADELVSMADNLRRQVKRRAFLDMINAKRNALEADLHKTVPLLAHSQLFSYATGNNT